MTTSFVDHLCPGNSLEADRDSMTLRTVFGDPLVVRWQDVEAVEFRRMRQPLAWSTFVVIRLKSGGHLPQMFAPLWSAPLRRALVSLGWHVEEGVARHPR